MPTMNEFKFNCPGCGQHILASHDWIGRQINCPSCNDRITVPSPAKEEKSNEPALPPARGARPKLPGGLLRTGLPATESGTGTGPAPAAPAPEKEGQAAKAPPAKEPKKDAPVLPPGQGTRPQLPGGLLQTDSPAKAAEALTAPAPALPAPEKGGKVAKAPPAKEAKKNAPSVVSSPSAGPKKPGGRLRVELPAPSADTGTTPATPPLSSENEGEVETLSATATETGPEAVATGTKPGEQPRVAVLSPAVKLDMVRAVRRRIADESTWLPGKVKGAAAYAGKMENGELVLLEATSPEATRFSLIGAFLKEMDVRRVVRTATGRRRFLDEEIPEAIRAVLLEQVSEEEREPAAARLTDEDLQTISRAQCLAVLERLENRYLRRAEQIQVEKAKRKVGGVRLPDLIKKLEKKVGLTPEEVATALYHELMDVRRRLERLESRISQNK